ncbi:uncharacterized protein TRIADDRAFT_21554 [Trichoplax adhaerens]|uniref:Mitochondrial-processing peptidase subunit alpha n=1 Tax=Trichoplax adhaerens TaxID=10228 RepID=B3RNV1_TRIAD|nr:hypothetical protein TRIADDRAFT_21554 [Trichoplax adhaerens]EDV27526.1 hypothetical protein TRIADDRAFT_21554 [Trichoplax adhaerens]|eukprot:XP_002109360.1 hypothetical protein TRIADDRAFT_21554 [Trichoplax adhaerens]
MAWQRLLQSPRQISSGRYIHQLSRYYCSSYQQIPLSQPLPNIATPKYAPTIENSTQNPQLTQLSNGIKVITAPCYGQVGYIGAIVDAGSRYELAFPKGISHLMGKICFQGSRKFENKEDFIDKLDSYGVNVQCEMNRDCAVYSISGFRHGIPDMFAALADSILFPDLSQRNVENQKAALNAELEHIKMMADAEIILTELIHGAAYGEKSVGFSKFADMETFPEIDTSSLQRYHELLYTPKRLVIGGVGVNHQELVELAEKYFVSDVPSWFKSSTSPVEDETEYIGSNMDLPKAPAGPTMTAAMVSELSHAAFALQGVSYMDPDFFSLAVLSLLMGGGGSFSAGGPGKGMYSRIYRSVLCNYYWMFSCLCLQHCYVDSGLFVINASAPPEQMGQLAEVVMTTICNMKNGFHKDEVSRAKRQLQSVLLMNLESKQIMLEDLCRQTLSLPAYTSVQELCDNIEQVTEESLIRVVDRILSSKLSVAAYGNLKHFPSHEQMQEAMTNNGRIKSQSRFSFYS